MGIQFGSFDQICQTAALVICPLVGSSQGIEPSCYSRNVEISGTLIFQPCESGPLSAASSEFPDAPHVFLHLARGIVPFSNMFRSYRSDFYDGHYDLPHP